MFWHEITVRWKRLLLSELGRNTATVWRANDRLLFWKQLSMKNTNWNLLTLKYAKLKKKKWPQERKSGEDNTTIHITDAVRIFLTSSVQRYSRWSQRSIAIIHFKCPGKALEYDNDKTRNRVHFFSSWISCQAL